MTAKPLFNHIRIGQKGKPMMEFESDIICYPQGEVKSAVEYLLWEIDDLYHKIGKTEVWEASNDTVCEMCEDFVKKKIKETFPDITK